MANDEQRYVFSSIEDIVAFVAWIQSNFNSTDEYHIWFDHSMEQLIPTDIFCTRQSMKRSEMHRCDECQAQFLTRSGLNVHSTVVHKRKLDNSKFWEIIENSYKNTTGDHNEPEVPDTD